MPDLFENPIGLDGFEFVEFCAPEKGTLEPVFEAMGFSHVATHRSKDAHLWRQGGINLIANYEPHSAAWYFAQEHGPSACGMAFRVRDAADAWAGLMDAGAQPVETESGPMELNIPAIKGIGGANLYLVDRYADAEGKGLSIYDIDFEYLEGVDRHPAGAGFKLIDHLTHNVYGGRMKYWADYYETLFNFREIRYFDIKGEYTGLTSKALTAPDGKIRIPLNEEGESGKGQIEEYLREFNGEGIQHIALICDDLVACWDNLKQLGVPFMTAPPATYYEMLSERLPGHGEDVEALKTRGILLDGTTEGGSPRLLLQIFAQAQVGPVFFEFIQRKGDEGFGEGNFKALFESMERDQIERGVLKVEEPAQMTDHPIKLGGVHHAAYRCKDAKETVEWYQKVLGMDYVSAFSEDHVPSTGEYDPYMHVFLDAGNGNVVAFFELPNQKDMGRDENTPAWVQHLAFRVGSEEELMAAKDHAESLGIDVLGPTHHGIFKSIYFFDPNGHRVELAADIGTDEQYAELKRVAMPMLEEWSQTKKAPRHADWLHELAREGHGKA